MVRVNEPVGSVRRDYKDIFGGSWGKLSIAWRELSRAYVYLISAKVKFYEKGHEDWIFFGFCGSRHSFLNYVVEKSESSFCSLQCFILSVMFHWNIHCWHLESNLEFMHAFYDKLEIIDVYLGKEKKYKGMNSHTCSGCLLWQINGTELSLNHPIHLET